MNHYDWLDENLPAFFSNLGIDLNKRCAGIITAHGDKCYGYKDYWERNGVPFYHGVAIYLLSYLKTIF